ncbi:MAG: cellulose biosynthesis cyclic di-GMP-binding regulatory protein BcsB [Ilumatobacter sp.]|uniref:cellulose biosynthesis cyclic di-GMP-binding regulatory protein BcsB n=1 Tax=Ilumatobacter sp. TaxID=1967498 RepID=UPI0026238D44|nr:cellulose biosynthesis cyclic di-GMP-binding regulatory protein BcsB [Ilumatobacter sp.]MDJ0769309.1 cellulose biosynthesis cyclic di-GMP-binding regulatory protein BcsB [Ilumatobacter sp.]
MITVEVSGPREVNMQHPPTKRFSRRARAVGLAACALWLTSGATSALAAPPEDTVPAPEPEPASETAPPAPTISPDGIVIEGFRGFYEQPVFVPFGRTVATDGVATAIFHVPDLVVNAAVVAELNGRPVGSWALGDGPGTTQVDIPLPAGLLEPGSNDLRLETNVPLDGDGACRDTSHPGRWVELAGPFDVRFDTVPGTPLSLRDFPEAFVTEADTTTIIIDKGDGAHLTAAATVGGALIEALGRDHNVVVVDSDDGVGGAQIRVAVDPVDPGISISSAADGSPRVDLVATHGEQLIRIAEALMQPGARSQMSGASIDVIDAASLPIEPSAPLQEASDTWLDGASLDELGFGGTSLEGPGVDRVTYTVDLPIGGTISFMELTIDAVATVAAPGLDVYVNGRLVGFAELSAEIDSFAFDVPAELLRPGTNFVRFEADLGTSGGGGGCGGGSSTVTPTTEGRIDILGSTEIRLHEGVGLVADLDDLPYTFRSFTDTRAAVVVTPTEPTVAEAERAVQLAILLGGRGLTAAVVTADEALAEPPTGHRVVFGTADRQPALADDVAALPLGRSVPDRWPGAIEIQLDDRPHTAAIQMVANRESGLTIAVTGRTDDDVLAALDVLLQPELRVGLTGSLALVSVDPLDARSISYEGGEPAPLPTPVESEFDLAPPVTQPPATVAESGGFSRPEVIDEQTGRSNPLTDLVIIVVAALVIGAGAFAYRRFGGRWRPRTTATT